MYNIQKSRLYKKLGRIVRVFVVNLNEIFTINAPMFDSRGVFANMTTFDTLMKCYKRVNGSRS